jgi:Zn-dependent peptidase ImmA (M78 family)
MPFRSAERLLKRLGITEPGEIDLEAIAYSVGVKIYYQSLDGCDACIVGNTSEGIIVVNIKSSVQRKRFSIAHELGHWELHRDEKLVCRLEDQSTSSTERSADAYAADLIMPHYIFDPLVQQYSTASLGVIHKLSETFNVSQTATAIRLIESNRFPALLVCHGQEKRKW